MRFGRFSDRNCVQVAKLVFYTADTTTTRLLLAWASAGYALLLVLPIFTPGMQHYFARPAFSLMAVVPGGEWTWFVLLMVHFVGVHWRIIEQRERIVAGLVINSLGFGLWFYSTLALNIGLGRATPTAALEWIIIFFSGWALFRTGLGDEVVTA